MSRLNHDGHDASQYLPRGVPPVNAYRAQHGSVRWEGEAIKALTWLPDILEHRGRINGDHLNVCLTIKRATTSTMNALAIENVRAYLTDVVAVQNKCQCIDKAKCQCGTDIFYNLLTRLNRKKSYICFWLVTDEMNQGNIGVAIREIGFIKEALEDAHKIIDDCKNRSNV